MAASNRTTATDKQQIRTTIRNIRQNLSSSAQASYAKQLADTLDNWSTLKDAQHIAGYLSQDNELSLESYFSLCRHQSKSLYLPVLKPLPPNRLWFAPYFEGTSLIPNKYQILEPDIPPNLFIRVSHLDAVLFPLVAFDRAKNRVGMGGGFYDRTFAHLKRVSNRPRFIGIAYQEQQVDQIDSENWDLPLDAIATPNQIIE